MAPPITAACGHRLTGVAAEWVRDEPQASDRRMKVDFQSADGSAHFTWVTVDYHQHPVVGEEVTVVYRASDPGQATALGFESDGVFYRGLGTVLTCIFGGIGLFLAVCYWLGRRKDRKKRAS